MAGHVCSANIVSLENSVATMTKKIAPARYPIENFQLCPLRVTSGAVVVLFLFTWLVQILDLVCKLEDSIFDRIDGCVKVNIVVVFVDRPLLPFSSLLP